MNKLIIDTASKNLYVALVNDTIKEIHVVGKNHAQVLMKHIDTVLGNLSIDDIDEIIVGVGPGSYTGVRVAVTIAKMLSWTKNIPLREVSSLYIQVSGYDGLKSSMIDARRQNAFCASFDDTKIVVEEMLREIGEFKEIALGRIYTEDDFKANPIKIIEASKVVSNVHGLVPNYLRKTEAERNKENAN